MGAFLWGLSPTRMNVSTSPFFSGVFVSCHFVSVFVRWLGGSFAKLGFNVGLCGFANVPPNALATIGHFVKGQLL